MNIKPVPLVNFQGRSHCKVVRETKGGRASPLAKVFFCFKNICKIFLLLLFHYVLWSSSSQTKPKQNTSVPYSYIFSQKDQTKYIFYLLNHYPHMNEHLGSWISTLYILSRRCDECLYGNSTFNLLLFSLFERTHTNNIITSISTLSILSPNQTSDADIDKIGSVKAHQPEKRWRFPFFLLCVTPRWF